VATEQELHLAEKIIVAILPEMLDFLATLAEMPKSHYPPLNEQITKAQEIGQRVKKIIEESK
jgi:hypothetical protein